MIRIRIPPFRLIQIECFTLNAETFLQIKRQLVFMILLWFYYGFIMVFVWFYMVFEKPEILQK
jgi:hypothetical protein